MRRDGKGLKQTKVLLICKDYSDNTGIGRYNQHLDTFLTNKGVEIKIINSDDIVYDSNFDDFENFRIKNGLKNLDETIFTQWLLLLNTKLKLSVQKLLEENQDFDLIHCSNWQVYLGCVLLKELFNKPLVLTFLNAGEENDSKFSNVVKEFEKVGLKGSDLIFVSEEKLLNNIENKKVRFVNPVLMNWQNEVLNEYLKIMK